MESISQKEYEDFCRFLEQSCGIVLGESKQYLVSTRLGKLMQANSIQTLEQLTEHIRNNANSELRMRVLDAMTTNETSWFRDAYPYEILKHEILPRCAKKKLPEIRIWSAACSSGQEPYSISMTIHDYLKSHPGSLSFIQIIATDLSPSMLNEARSGRYGESLLARGLTDQQKQNYFSPIEDGMEVKQDIRDRVIFKEQNLLESFTILGKFDVIFMRNILIYLSESTRRDILDRVSNALQADGYLFLGGSESIASFSNRFEAIRLHNGVVYRLK